MTRPLLFAIPMKCPILAKTRLSTVMSGRSRHDLALRMFRRTLDVITRADCDKSVLVVTESPMVASLAHGHGAHVLLEEKAGGLNAAARRAARWAVERGFGTMAIVPVDLPLLSPGKVEALARMPLCKGQLRLCKSSDGGTNFLMASPPDAIEFRYGDGSFVAHRREARLKSVACFTLADSMMRFDLDTPGDLERLSVLNARAGERPSWR